MKAFVVAVVSLIAVAGCGKDKVTGPGGPAGPQYLVPSTPNDVLFNMQRAYAARDSTEYKGLFDDAYLGNSMDPSDGTNLNFTKTDEAQHIAALARRGTITIASIVYPPSIVRFTDLTDPPGWATIQMSQGFSVQIDDIPSSYYIRSGTTQEFKFAPTSPDSTSPTDTTWKIIRWREVGP